MIHCGEHALADILQHRFKFERAFHARLEILFFLLRPRVLQVIKRSAIGDGGNQRTQLKRRHLNPFAEARHASDAAASWRLGGQCAGLFL